MLKRQAAWIIRTAKRWGFRPEHIISPMWVVALIYVCVGGWLVGATWGDRWMSAIGLFLMAVGAWMVALVMYVGHEHRHTWG